MRYIDGIKLGTTEALLTKGSLMYAFGIKPPDLPLYNDHSVKVLLSNGGQAYRGFKSLSLTWNGLTWEQAYTIRKLVDDSIASADGLMYARINRGWNGSGPGQDWIDIKGVPHIPDRIPATRTRGILSNDITLFLGNVIIVNDPSTS